MERKLYFGIMTPGALLTIAFGLWLWLGYGITGGWLHAKLALVADPGRATTSGSASCCATSPHDRNRHGHVFYRWLNEIPALPILVRSCSS